VTALDQASYIEGIHSVLHWILWKVFPQVRHAPRSSEPLKAAEHWQHPERSLPRADCKQSVCLETV
jgi:hypothetical protein